MIKCIVVDDEKPARDEISYLISMHSKFEIVKTFDSSSSLLANIFSYDVDVIFVDINMPIMSGIEMVEKLNQLGIDTHIVFVTAHDAFAVKAFELHAIDYLLKPVSEDRISKCLTRIADKINDTNYEQKLELLLSQIDNNKNGNFCLHRDGKIVPLKLSEIIYAKAENKGTKIETTKGIFLTSMQLRELERKLLSKKFFRCHRSFLINLSYVSNIEPWFNRTYQVDLENINEKIPVSRNYVQDFKELMNIL